MEKCQSPLMLFVIEISCEENFPTVRMLSGIKCRVVKCPQEHKLSVEEMRRLLWVSGLWTYKT